MTGTNRTATEPFTQPWTLSWAVILAVGCLLAGIGAGWLLREWKSPVADQAAQAAAVAKTDGSQAAAPASLKQMADANAVPLLAKLQSDPNNADLLTSIGNLYYDAKLYPTAIDYYGRALTIRPADVSVRTDMGTAWWYLGDADAAIGAFNQALVYEPNSPNTLFNRGVVKWQGKGDNAGAMADWNKLLATNPTYAARDKVEQMIAQVEQQTASSRR